MATAKNSIQAALSIAGSDPSGGAGIQADIKTFTVIGVYGGAVISSLTVQNTRGVFAVQPVDAHLVREQIECVLADLNVTHIKIGMLGSAAVTESVCEALSAYTGEIIYDPVLVSSSGRQLIDSAGHEKIRGCLLPLCTVLTPNVPELSVLAERDCRSKDALLNGAGELIQCCKRLRVVVVTGGHFEPMKQTITDFMVVRNPGRDKGYSHEEITHPRITTPNTHGTGCTFSAAFTAYHLLCKNDPEAFRKTVEYIDGLVRESASMTIGHGTGPLMHYRK